MQEDTQEENEQRIEQLVREIKEKFRAMNDGETSPSAYDTAWVARVPSVDDADKPQFPMCVDWILKNQIQDGSWGEPSFYLLYDRLVNTLACVLALKTRIPLDVMHSVHTTMLYNLEALQEVVQWERILKLQSRDGSFLSSPASTAVAFSEKVRIGKGTDCCCHSHPAIIGDSTFKAQKKGIISSSRYS